MAMTRSFGGIIGSGLQDFFRNLLVEGIKMVDTIMRIGAFAFQVGRILYFFSKAIMRVVEAFSFLTPIIRVIANVLGSRIGQTVLSIIALLTSLAVVLIGIGKVMASFLGGILVLNSALATNATLWGAVSSLIGGTFLSSILSGVAALPALIAEVFGLGTALSYAAAAMTVLTGGLAAIGAIGAIGLGGFGVLKDAFAPDVSARGRNNRFAPGSGGVTNNVTMNVQGDMDETSRQRITDVTKGIMYEDDLQDGKWSP
jgi:hypothetical protein